MLASLPPQLSYSMFSPNNRSNGKNLYHSILPRKRKEKQIKSSKGSNKDETNGNGLNRHQTIILQQVHCKPTASLDLFYYLSFYKSLVLLEIKVMETWTMAGPRMRLLCMSMSVNLHFHLSQHCQPVKVDFKLTDDAYVHGKVAEVVTFTEFTSALNFHKSGTGLPVVVSRCMCRVERDYCDNETAFIYIARCDF